MILSLNGFGFYLLIQLTFIFMDQGLNPERDIYSL